MEIKSINEKSSGESSEESSEENVGEENGDKITNGATQIDLQKPEEIEQLVENPTWREILVDLVKKEKFDPWNLDIVDITNKYIERIKKMKLLDLHISSNVILAAAILLHFKAETLRLESEEQFVEQQVFVEEPPVEVSMLQLRVRVPPKRTVTLADLIQALEEVMKIEKRREERLKEKPIQLLELKIPTYNIEKEMENILTKAQQLADREGWLTFSQLLPKEKTPKNIVFTLLPVLHLVQEEKLYLLQERIFGEIFLKLINNKKIGQENREEIKSEKENEKKVKMKRK